MRRAWPEAPTTGPMPGITLVASHVARLVRTAVAVPESVNATFAPTSAVKSNEPCKDLPSAPNRSLPMIVSRPAGASLDRCSALRLKPLTAIGRLHHLDPFQWPAWCGSIGSSRSPTGRLTPGERAEYAVVQSVVIGLGGGGHDPEIG
jgi:hypothetical protein